MKPTKKSRVSLRDLARETGLSKTAVGYALQNVPRVSETTRRRVLLVARKIGYVPDARIASWMTQVREARSKELLPMAWLNTESEREAWQKLRFLTPFRSGASERATELGYRLEDIWIHEPGLSMKRISQILVHRGIEGVIVTHPARHIRLDWTRLAGVCLEGALLMPPLHGVRADISFNLHLALKTLRKLGYRRIGICLAEQVNSFSFQVIRAVAHYFNASLDRADQVKPLFYAYDVEEEEKEAVTLGWLRKERPEVVVGHDNRLLDWVQTAGFQVPKQMGVVHLAVDDDVLDWAGIHSNRREIGRAAADKLVSLIRNRQFGAPDVPGQFLIRGKWHPGWTVQGT